MTTKDRIQQGLLLPSFWGGWVGFLVFFSGCVKDPIYNTDHPDQAQVTITTSWKDRGEEIEKPSVYTISTSTIQEEATTDTYTLSRLLNPGDYTFYLYNPVAQIPVTDGVANVNTVSEGTSLEPLPDWLFTGMLERELAADRDYQLAAIMHQQVRGFTLVLEVKGEHAERVSMIRGYLSGVAGRFTIDGNVYSEASRVALDFIKIPEGADAGKWSATLRLLGITGHEQKLEGSLSFDGDLEDIPVESDLSQSLAGFNTNKKTPLILGGEIELSAEAGFTATIRN
ncbi:MAG: hypothetical protein LUG98_16485, partial [Tannerellaceae bacterium]|nr:hypothetical protein [Tannerellaceae bacterium]